MGTKYTRVPGHDDAGGALARARGWGPHRATRVAIGAIGATIAVGVVVVVVKT